MEIILLVLTILASISIGWSIGANDAANSLGPAVGSKVLTLRQGIILITIFGFLGAMLQGKYVSDTIGKGIVPLNTLPPQTAAYIALTACLSACFWVVLATYRKIPISTSHSIVGAVAGGGLALGTSVRWEVLGSIFICWILTPLGAAVTGFIFYFIFKNTLPRLIPEKYLKVILNALIIISGCYVAFTWGANDVANAVGPLMGANLLHPLICVLIGAGAIVLGIVTWGYKVIETIGSEITQLLPIMAFSAQLASAVNVHIYTLCGIPVSTSHSIVGAIFGVGLVSGVKVINLKIMREIIFCWLATPFISGVISFVLLKLLSFIVKI